MATQSNNPIISITASGTVGRYRLVTAAGAQAGADANDDVVGVSQGDYTTDQEIDVRLRSAGTCKVVASKAISLGAVVRKAANGKVSDTGSGAILGRALSAASGDNSVFEVVLF